MKKIYLILFAALHFQTLGQIAETGQLLDAMQTKHRGKWFKTLTFQQETIRYNGEGSLRDTALWNEAVRYPDHFRIDYLNTERTAVFKSDSAYRFEKGQFLSKAHQPQEFLLFKGGLYFMSPSEVLNKLKTYGYDTTKIRRDRFNGQDVYVVGADKGDTNTKQFWLNADHFYLVRRISQTANGAVLDVHYGGHQRFGRGWVERNVTFYLNKRLIQIENYLDIKVEVELTDDVFSATHPKLNWYQ